VAAVFLLPFSTYLSKGLHTHVVVFHRLVSPVFHTTPTLLPAGNTLNNNPPPPHTHTHTQVSEAAVSQLRSQLQAQKKELEAAAAASLEKAEETFTKQLAEMQTLLADYQTQVGGRGMGGFFWGGGGGKSVLGLAVEVGGSER